MGVNTGYGVFRLLKARVDLGHGGKDGRIFMYMLYDRNEVRLFHYHYAAQSDPDFPSFNIKGSWRDFCSLIDGATSEEDLFDVELMVSDLREVFKEIGVYDLKEENMSKFREVENMLVKRASQFYDGEIRSFIKIDLMTVLEAEELLSKFADEDPENLKEEASEESSGESSEEEAVEAEVHKMNVPRVIVSCSVVMDPLKGIPISTIREGDLVTLAIPEDSFVYKTLKQQDPNFDGTLERSVMAIKENESERIVMEFSIFEEVAGVVIAQKNLKIKAVHDSFSSGSGGLAHLITPTNIMFFAGACTLLLVYLILQYLE